MSIFEALLELFGELSTNLLISGKKSKKDMPNFEVRPPGGGAIFISVISELDDREYLPKDINEKISKDLIRRLSKAGYMASRVYSSEHYDLGDSKYVFRVELASSSSGEDFLTGSKDDLRKTQYVLICKDASIVVAEVPLDYLLSGDAKKHNQNAVLALNKNLFELRNQSECHEN